MKVSIIGAGAMGGSIARGLLTACDSLIIPSDITVSNPTEAKLRPLAQLGANVTTSNTEAVKDADLIILCVKPWFVEQVITQIKPHIDNSTTEVAIVAAGIPLASLGAWLQKPSQKAGSLAPSLPSFCIVIPNTAIALRQSMTFIVNGPAPCPLSLSIFSSLGTAMSIEERQLPAATALASCGIAYAMRYVRAATEGGVELGFKASVAQDIIVQTLLGASALLSVEGTHPESEIDKVTTPGGITIRGLNAMEEHGFTTAVIAGLRASATPK